MKYTLWANQHAHIGILERMKRWFHIKWMQFKLFCRYVFEMIKLGLVITAVAIIAYMYGQGSQTIIFADAQKNDTLSTKIQTMQNEVVEKLAHDENRTNIPCVPDDNKAKSLPIKDKVSCGVMQFKISTIQHYYGILKLGTISDQQAVILAIDPDKAKALAKRVIFETQGGIFNWTTATPEIVAKVETIKELMK